MGLVGAGNVGTAISVLVAPPLAQWLGWQAVYGVAACAILLPALVMVLFARSPTTSSRTPRCASLWPACSSATAGCSA